MDVNSSMEQFETALAIYRGARINAVSMECEGLDDVANCRPIITLQFASHVMFLLFCSGPEQSGFCWGAVPYPYLVTGHVAPWVLRRIEQIRDMDDRNFMEYMLNFVESVLNLSSQEDLMCRVWADGKRWENKPFVHFEGRNTGYWSLFQVAFDCRQYVESGRTLSLKLTPLRVVIPLCVDV
jgi:hypothetical protein